MRVDRWVHARGRERTSNGAVIYGCRCATTNDKHHQIFILLQGQNGRMSAWKPETISCIQICNERRIKNWYSCLVFIRDVSAIMKSKSGTHSGFAMIHVSIPVEIVENQEPILRDFNWTKTNRVEYGKPHRLIECNERNWLHIHSTQSLNQKLHWSYLFYYYYYYCDWEH